MPDLLSVSDRSRKVEVILLGRGIAAAALALHLTEQGRRVAWLIERPGLLTGPFGVPTAGDEAAAQLERWEETGMPGITRTGRGWRVAYDSLLPALAARVAVTERCWAPIGTWVRGISVIESRVLGAIAEDSRYDGRTIVNAAQGDRHHAFARMLRHPESFRTDHAPPPPQNSDGVEGAWQLPDTDDPAHALEAALALAPHLT